MGKKKKTFAKSVLNCWERSHCFVLINTALQQVVNNTALCVLVGQSQRWAVTFFFYCNPWQHIGASSSVLYHSTVRTNER